jgi:hypothetical protein
LPWITQRFCLSPFCSINDPPKEAQLNYKSIYHT